MNQQQQVIQTMEQLGGFATLGALNQKMDVTGWNTNTPYASIRRIVQNKKYFFKIKPGLWALNAYREKLGVLLGEKQTPRQKAELDHYYYQGLLLEIGNVKNFRTFIPNPDKNKTFLQTTLGDLRNLECMHQFGYREIVERAQLIDVVWFNRRRMPYAAFEVEHTTDFTGALSKYIALQDFNTKFYVVSGPERKRQFENKISRDEYHPIRARVKFLDYEKLGTWHGQSMEIARMGEMP